ncbi:FecR family protein [Siphonobacter aquaeclarae]|uniref:FecR family protein n=1 Tax=Siphonobacter aquaeclarae TaxID=563176 RepID=A0A1G9NID7_9BACT|nr:FecR domain-containing protein [Siphonobacter aquaeclarae]SDL85715.1 FecR family protein [Siphonobacter aquaeclarae]
MKDQINAELIFRYFSGNATAFEKELINEWSADPQARERLFIWLQEWENQNLQYAADDENAIARHFIRMEDGTPPEEKEQQETPRIRRWTWKAGLIAAATAAAVLTAGWLGFDEIRYQTYATGYGQIERLELPDGSRVVLNANSTLRVPRFGFGNLSREVYMTGEADFAVIHTENHQKFIVRTEEDFAVEVLGTEFNVYARPRRSRVVLNKGKVKLLYLNGQREEQLLMKPGDLVNFDAAGHAEVKRTENPQHFSAWKAHRFVFENESLRDICDQFEDNFGLEIHIPDSTLAALTISGSFTAISAEELFEILAEGSGFSYQRSADGKTITLSY